MEAVLLGAGGALLVQLGAWHGMFARALDREKVPVKVPARYPSISIIRPVRGLDVGAEENVRAALTTSYPGDVETLYVFDDETDAAVPLVHRLIAEHRKSGRPGTATLMFAGEPPPGRTGKLHAMIAGMHRATGTLIAFGDSDSRPAPELLTELVEALVAAPDIGVTFTPVVVSDPPRTSGDVGYALMMNALYGPAVARAAGERGRVPFLMAQLAVFRPEALAAIGGPACADGQLVDDMYIGRCLNRVGFANVMTTHPLAIANSGTSMQKFLHLYRRWMLFGRNGLPLRFTWPLWVRGACTWLATLLLVIALVTGAGWAALVAAATLAGQGASLLNLHARLGGAPIPWRLRWMSIGMFLITPLVLVSMKRHAVEWRGRDYALGRKARLALPA